MDLKELKAKAYDLMAQMEYLQRELIKLNQEIAKESQAKES